MSQLVDPTEIENIVGVTRHARHHYARAVSAETTVYILHSQLCRDSTPDLRDCPFSLALDRGIEDAEPWAMWHQLQDRPVRVQVINGYLLPIVSDGGHV
jgi:hypothetical protein